MQKAGSIKRENTNIRSSIYKALIILMIPFGSIHGQDKDAGLWTGLEVEKELNGWLGIQGAFEVRLDNNISRVKKYLGEAGMTARLNKYLDAGITYRYSYRYLPEYNWFPVHRIYSDIKFEYDWTYWSASARFRFTADKIPGFRNEGILETTARLKPQIAYNIRRTPLRARGSVEFFMPITQEQMLITEEIRYKLGMQYVLNRSITFELSHLYQRGTYKKKPQHNYIWIIRLNYNL